VTTLQAGNTELKAGTEDMASMTQKFSYSGSIGLPILIGAGLLALAALAVALMRRLKGDAIE